MQSDANEKLLPCPFCNGEAELRGHAAPEFWVACPAIGCKASTESFGAKERAIASWNTRALSAPSTPSEPEVAAAARTIHDALYADDESGAWMSGKCPLDSVTIDGDVDLLKAARAVLYAHPAPKPVEHCTADKLQPDWDTNPEYYTPPSEPVAVTGIPVSAPKPVVASDLGPALQATAEAAATHLKRALAAEARIATLETERDAAFAKGRDAGLEEAALASAIEADAIDAGYLIPDFIRALKNQGEG